MGAETESNVFSVDASSFVETVISTANAESDKLLRKYANSFHVWIVALDKHTRSDLHMLGIVTQPISQVIYSRSESSTSWFHVSNALNSWAGPRMSALGGSRNNPTNRTSRLSYGGHGPRNSVL